MFGDAENGAPFDSVIAIFNEWVILNNPTNYGSVSDMGKPKLYKVYQISITNLDLQKKLDKIKKDKTTNFSKTIEIVLERHYHV